MLWGMSKEFEQSVWDARLDKELRGIVKQAIAEDLGEHGDWTTLALVPADAQGRAAVVARGPGVAAGLPGVPILLAEVDPRLRWLPKANDGDPMTKGRCIGVLEGPAQTLLGVERILLNYLGRMSGVATLTRRYVDAIAGTGARIYDTRKTTPGWRKLEKYAVRCGGACNHRAGLDAAVLIKDNHLAFGAESADSSQHFTPAEAVCRARQFVADHAGDPAIVIEVEVDTLGQLDAVLPTRPDIVLLDNMAPSQLHDAVTRRNAFDRTIQLEASGGVNLTTVRDIAASGVERVSVGALTHSAVSLDFGLDWNP